MDTISKISIDSISSTRKPAIIISPPSADKPGSSSDPLVFFKLRLIALFEGIRAERQLIGTVDMPLDHRYATSMKPAGGGRAVLGYHDHYVVDGDRDRIILSALVTPASIMDNTPLLDMIHFVRSRWQLEPEIAVDDAKYGTAPNL